MGFWVRRVVHQAVDAGHLFCEIVLTALPIRFRSAAIQLQTGLFALVRLSLGREVENAGKLNFKG